MIDEKLHAKVCGAVTYVRQMVRELCRRCEHKHCDTCEFAWVIEHGRDVVIADDDIDVWSCTVEAYDERFGD